MTSLIVSTHTDYKYFYLNKELTWNLADVSHEKVSFLTRK